LKSLEEWEWEKRRWLNAIPHLCRAHADGGPQLLDDLGNAA
jgi:hypothetical protein